MDAPTVLYARELETASDPAAPDGILRALGTEMLPSSTFLIEVVQDARWAVVMAVLSNPSASITTLGTLLAGITQGSGWRIWRLLEANQAVWSNPAVMLAVFGGDEVRSLLHPLRIDAALRMLSIVQVPTKGRPMRVANLINAGSAVVIKQLQDDDQLTIAAMTTPVQLSRNLVDQGGLFARALKRGYVDGKEVQALAGWLRLLGMGLWSSADPTVGIAAFPTLDQVSGRMHAVWAEFQQRQSTHDRKPYTVSLVLPSDGLLLNP